MIDVANEADTKLDVNTPQFVHLRVHSEYSLTSSVVKVKKLVAQCKEQNVPAVAVTDNCNFYALVKFYKAALGGGVKPIVASDFILSVADQDYVISLYAMNNSGYKNITELMSEAYLTGQTLGGDPRISWEQLKQYSEGVLALSGGKQGEVGAALLKGNNDEARQLLEKYQALFSDRFYIELQRTDRSQDERYVYEAAHLAAQCNCPVVATNDVYFLSTDNFSAHETRVSIGDHVVLDDPGRDRNYSPEQYFKSPQQMIELFSDMPSAIENSIEIAKRCNVQLHLGEYFLPEFPVSDTFEEDKAYATVLNRVSFSEYEEQTRKVMLEKWAGKEDTAAYIKELRGGVFFRVFSRKGLDDRLETLFDTSLPEFPGIEKEYVERLDFELDIILQMGFPGYFLIVMDFIQWSKDNDIPVGPGRGSGAGSLVAYAQKITDLDPLKYDLLFERFLNPERVSMPDFDVDFCMDRRGEVIDYVSENYGRMAVSQIVTFGTMAAKAVIRDVARVQSKPYSLADKLSKSIPFTPGISLSEAFEQEAPLREMLANDDDAQEIWDMAIQLEGTVRGVGKHAGGVVIAPTKLTDFSAIYCDEHGEGMVTQFDKNDVEEAGLVKFDFLGLRTLTIIDWAKKIIDRQHAEKGLDPLIIEAIPLEDKPTYDLLKRAETTAVFQLESRGMKELIKRLQPDNLEDMIALVALFRPGPLDSGMVDDFVNRKHGRAEVAYPDAKYQHECLQPILEPTYGVIVYQEQVMQIAQELAGYSLGGADMLRRAMGKKKPEEMAKQRGTFRDGAISQGVQPELAMKIFDLVEKFAGYGFNKSHSAAYALVSYQTAWLKTHYPAPFMAAVLSSELQNTDKIVTLVEECRTMKLPLVNPDVNSGDYLFTVNDANEIVYGLGAIKGLGEGPVEALIEARDAGGPFLNLFDFCQRVNLRKVNKRALEALVKSGSFDSLGERREVLFAAIVEAVKTAEQETQNQNAGMFDMFADIAAEDESDVYQNFQAVAHATGREKLTGEKETLGLFLTGHPIDDYEADLIELRCKRLGRLQADKKKIRVAGMIVETRYIQTKRGDKLAIVTLDDRTGRIDCTIFSSLLDEVGEKLTKDEVVFIDGEVEEDSFSGGLRMRVEAVMDMTEVRAKGNRKLVLTIDASQWTQTLKRSVQSVLEGAKAEMDEGCPVAIKYTDKAAKATVSLRLAEHWRIKPTDDVLNMLTGLLGAKQLAFK